MIDQERFPVRVCKAFLPVWVALGCLAAVVTPAAGELFDRYEVVTGSARRQTVLTGFFLDGALADLAVIDIGEKNNRRLRIYAFDDAGWEPRLEARLGPEVLFVDVAGIGGRDRLITYRSGRLNWFDPDSATERALLDVAMDYNSTHDLEGSPTQPGAELPHVDITRDLNHDGRDDLVLPGVEGFWISVQLGDGSFAEAMRVGPPEPFRDEVVGNLGSDGGTKDDSRSYGELGITAATLPLYLSRIHEMDYDQDGLSDLLFWNQDHFDVHLQKESGLFAPVAKTFAPQVPIDSDGAYSHTFDFIDQGVFPLLFGIGEKTRRTVLHSVRDVNGDRVADLITLTLSGRSVARQRSIYEVHFGKSTTDGTVFSPEVGTTIHPRGRAGAMQPFGYSSQWMHDFDRDGRVDIMFRDVSVGIGGMMRALVGNSIPINLEFYRVEDGVYPDRPTTTRRIRRFAPFAGLGNVFFPAVLMGDVNGDGRSDLLVGESPKELQVFLGVPGPGLLARWPRKVAVAMPYDERKTRLVDLNRDGKQDLLMHHGPTGHAPDQPHRLTTLIAR